MKIPRPILERRRAVRIEHNLIFKIGHKNYDVKATTVNLSSHGVRCLVDKDIPLMSQLDITFFLPFRTEPKANPRAIHARGVIVRKQKDSAKGHFTIAIFFTQISENSQRTLNKFIENHLKKKSARLL